MEDFIIRKIYIDSRFKTSSRLGNNADFEVMLPQVVNLPEKCIGFIDELIMPIAFYNVQENVSDKLYINVYYDGADHFSTITIPEKNYSVQELGSDIITELQTAYPGDVSFVGGGFADLNKITIQIVDSRISPPDTATFIIFDDVELLNGDYNSSSITEPQSINNILQNYKSSFVVYSSFKIEFTPDLHPLRNIYL